MQFSLIRATPTSNLARWTVLAGRKESKQLNDKERDSTSEKSLCYPGQFAIVSPFFHFDMHAFTSSQQNHPGKPGSVAFKSSHPVGVLIGVRSVNA